MFSAFECTSALSESGAGACRDAAEARLACVVKVSCEQIQANTGCEAEDAAQEKACG